MQKVKNKASNNEYHCNEVKLFLIYSVIKTWNLCGATCSSLPVSPCVGQLHQDSLTHYKLEKDEKRERRRGEKRPQRSVTSCQCSRCIFVSFYCDVFHSCPLPLFLPMFFFFLRLCEGKCKPVWFSKRNVDVSPKKEEWWGKNKTGRASLCFSRGSLICKPSTCSKCHSRSVRRLCPHHLSFSAYVDA